MILRQLFISFFKIGLFSFGGGYAAIPLINQQVVVNHGWMSLEAFSDVLTISQMTPGPIGINSATFIGIQLSGVLGAIVATVGFVIPSFVIVSILGHFYLKYNGLEIIQKILQGLRPVVVAIIMSAGVTLLVHALVGENSLSLDNLKIIQVGLFVVAMFLNLKLKYSPIKVMLLVGVMNVVIYYGSAML